MPHLKGGAVVAAEQVLLNEAVFPKETILTARKPLRTWALASYSQSLRFIAPGRRAAAGWGVRLILKTLRLRVPDFRSSGTLSTGS